jgi:Flp pilus assembly protein TadG
MTTPTLQRVRVSCYGKARRRRGGSIIEAALFMPWYVFLFVGLWDWGFYSHALVSVENAARVGAIYASASSTTAADSTTVCAMVSRELALDLSFGTLSTCSTSLVTSGPDGSNAALVTVAYLTQQMIPIPGVLPGRATVTRSVEMRLRS